MPEAIYLFKKYIDTELTTMVDMTNLYDVQRNVAFPPTNLDEISALLGVHVAMGNITRWNVLGISIWDTINKR